MTGTVPMAKEVVTSSDARNFEANPAQCGNQLLSRESRELAGHATRTRCTPTGYLKSMKANVQTSNITKTTASPFLFRRPLPPFPYLLKMLSSFRHPICTLTTIFFSISLNMNSHMTSTRHLNILREKISRLLLTKPF